MQLPFSTTLGICTLFNKMFFYVLKLCSKLSGLFQTNSTIFSHKRYHTHHVTRSTQLFWYRLRFDSRIHGGMSRFQFPYFLFYRRRKISCQHPPPSQISYFLFICNNVGLLCHGTILPAQTTPVTDFTHSKSNHPN